MFVRRRTQVGATEDQVCVSCLHFAGRFVSLHWHCVRRPSSSLSLRLRRGLTTAQGDTPGPITPAIMPSIITHIATIAMQPAGIAARRRCRPAALPAPIRASWKAAPRWLRPAPSVRPPSSPRRTPVVAGSGTPRGHRAGSVALRKCRRAVLPMRTPASQRIQAPGRTQP